jgi:hypothetical protein
MLIISIAIVLLAVSSSAYGNCPKRTNNSREIAKLGDLNDDCTQGMAHIILHGCNGESLDRFAAYMADYESKDNSCSDDEDTAECVKEVPKNLFAAYSRIAEKACKMVEAEFCHADVDPKTFARTSAELCVRIRERAQIADLSAQTIKAPLEDVWNWSLDMMAPHLLGYGGVFLFILSIIPQGSWTRLIGVSITVLAAASEAILKFAGSIGNLGGTVRVIAAALFGAFVVASCGLKGWNTANWLRGGGEGGDTRHRGKKAR